MGYKFPMMNIAKKRILRLLFISVVGLAAAGLIAFYQVQNEGLKKSIVASDFGGPFTLQNHLGENITHKDYEGQYRLIYFGFTYCPAICPTELQRMATILKELGTQGDVITPLFITVDPERDSVSVMKNYVEMFHPRLIGLTGTPAQIDEAKKSYKIYAAKVQDETMSDYTMDHSSFIYFMDKDNNLLRIFKSSDSIEDMTQIIKHYLS